MNSTTASTPKLLETLVPQARQWVGLHPWITILAILTTQLVLTRYSKGLRHVPGPFVASFSNFWKLRAVWNTNMHRENIRVHEDYGPIVRIGPNHVSANDPESVRAIYGVKNVFPKVCRGFPPFWVRGSGEWNMI